MCSRAQEHPGFNKQSSSHQTVHLKIVLADLFQLMTIPVSLEQPGMMTKETTLAPPMSSHAQEHPEPNKQNSSPQTVQQRIILAFLFPFLQTPLSSEHHRQETTA